jgi:uncharacterized phage protein gp47/JayE
MPLDRPTLQEIRDRVVGDLRSRLGGLDPTLRRSLLAVLGAVHASTAHELYGFIGSEIARRMLPDASGDGLRRLADLWGITPSAAAYATGVVTFTGTAATVVPIGTKLQDGAGVEYETTTQAIIGASSASVSAVVAGSDANQAAGALLSLISPIEGVDSSATVDSAGLTGGADEEGDDSLSSRLSDRLQETPQGGNAKDWEAWTREAILLYAGSSAARVWVTPPTLPSATIVISFVIDDQSPITATSPQIASVQAYLDDDDRRPLGARSVSGTPTLVALDVTISNLSPDEQSVKDAITSELADLVYQDGIPGGTLLISRIREAISRAVGELDHVLVSPVANVSHAAGELPVLGTVSFT